MKKRTLALFFVLALLLSLAAPALASGAPGPISSVTVTPAAGGKISLSWSASANAKTYVLQRHERGSSVWTTLSSNISGTGYTDDSGTVGKIYQYRVRGRDGAGFGDWKTSAEVAAMSGSTPGAVSTPAVKAANGKITVSWDAAEGAATYVLQRNEKGSSAWTTLASNLKETSYTDSKCTLGKVYRYRVRSRNVSAFGPFKVSVEVAAMSGTAPGPVSGVTAAAAAKQITVSWNAAEGAASYIVQRRARDAQSWTTLNSNVKECSFTDATGTVGAVYQYRVRSRNVSAYGPFKVSTEVAFMSGSTPGDIGEVTARSEGGKLTVAWTASSGAAGYIVQRREAGGSWANLATNVTELSFVDETGQAGARYQYRVRPRNGSIYGNFKASEEVTYPGLGWVLIYENTTQRPDETSGMYSDSYRWEKDEVHGLMCHYHIKEALGDDYQKTETLLTCTLPPASGAAGEKITFDIAAILVETNSAKYYFGDSCGVMWAAPGKEMGISGTNFWNILDEGAEWHSHLMNPGAGTGGGNVNNGDSCTVFGHFPYYPQPGDRWSVYFSSSGVQTEWCYEYQG